RREANYFERNADAVAYAAYREQGWSTASSEVESAHRHVVQRRLKVPGAGAATVATGPRRRHPGAADAESQWTLGRLLEARRTRWRQNAVARAAAPVIRRAA